MYDAVQMMREHISVGVRARGRGASPASFEVSFTGYDPVKVRNVTTAIANLFIDYNLKFREKLAAGTTQFLERELERMREELRQKEERVRQFKTKYMGMLPEHMESNYRILDQLQQQLASLNDTLQQIEDRKVLLREQQGRTENRQVDPQTPLTIDQLHQQLKSLESRYTDKHPDVIRLAAAIARIEEEQKKGNVKMSASSPGQGEAPQRQMMLVQREDLLSQLKLLDKQSQKLNEEKKQVSMAIEGYRRRIENGPKLEQVYVDLRRDYQQVDNNYQSLLQKKLQAEMAENLERTQKGEQFTILDPANLPEKPFKPNIPRIFLLSLVLALGCGFGLAVLRDYLDQTFWEWKELESFLQLPVLAAVPFINPGQERSPNMFKKAFAVCMVVSMASVLFYALLVLWGKSPMLFFI